MHIRWRFVTTFVGILLGTILAGVDVEYEGNDEIGTGKLRNAVQKPPSDSLRQRVPRWLDASVASIAAFYRERGYFDVGVESTVEWVDDGNVEATFSVKEGPRYSYDTVRVEAIDVLDTAGVSLPRLQTVRNGFYQRDDILRDRTAILRAYRNAGYLHAEVRDSLLIYPDSADARLFFKVEAKRLVTLDTLIVRRERAGKPDSLVGLTDEDLIRSLVPYEKGDTVTGRTNERVIEKLQSTQSFVIVRLEDSLLVREGDTLSALVLRTSETVPGRITTSVFYETQKGLGGDARISHSNVAGRFHELRFATTLAFRKQSFRFGYSTPLLFKSLVRFDNELDIAWYQLGKIHDSLNTGAFDGDFEVQLTSRFSRELTDFARLSTGGELVHTDQISAPELPGRATNLNTRTSLSLDYVDAPFRPSRGAAFAFTWGNGGSLDGQDVLSLLKRRHNWLEARSSYYYPPLSQVVLAARINGGRFFGSGGINSREFFLGGPRSVRAFQYREIRPPSPTDERLVPAYYLTSAEIRLGLLDFGAFKNTFPAGNTLASLRFVPFVDYGKVWDIEEGFELNTSGEATAYGIGLHYPLLGIFNFRLDFAWGTTGTGENNFRIVIDLANAF